MTNMGRRLAASYTEDQFAMALSPILTGILGMMPEQFDQQRLFEMVRKILPMVLSQEEVDDHEMFAAMWGTIEKEEFVQWSERFEAEPELSSICGYKEEFPPMSDLEERLGYLRAKMD